MSQVSIPSHFLLLEWDSFFTFSLFTLKLQVLQEILLLKSNSKQAALHTTLATPITGPALLTLSLGADRAAKRKTQGSPSVDPELLCSRVFKGTKSKIFVDEQLDVAGTAWSLGELDLC